MNLMDEVTAMSKSQEARAKILDRVRIEMLGLSTPSQIKVVEELMLDLATCLEKARAWKVVEPIKPVQKASGTPTSPLNTHRAPR